MSKENLVILENINSRRNSIILKKLRAEIPTEILDVIESSIVDSNKCQFIPVNTLYILALTYHIYFENIHINGKVASPSENFLINLFNEINKEIENQKNILLPGDKPPYISEGYDVDDPVSIQRMLVGYTKDKRWIECGDYLVELHDNRMDSPYHMDYHEIRFIKNGRMIKLFSYSKDNIKPFLDDLCIYLSSYSNYVRWSYYD